MKSLFLILFLNVPILLIAQDYPDCHKIDTDYSGECKSFFDNETLSHHFIIEKGDIIWSKSYFKNGDLYTETDKTKLEQYSFEQRILYKKGLPRKVIDVELGSGTASSMRRDGSSAILGLIKNKQLKYPWLVYNKAGNITDTIQGIKYDQTFNDPDEFIEMIFKGLLKGKLLDENRSLKTQEEKNNLPSPPHIAMEEAPIKKENEHNIVEYPDKSPAFPGGSEALLKYIEQNMIYPQDAKKKGDEGKVYLEFYVLKNGSISNISVLRGASKEFDQEAIRLVQKMPKWKPAQVDNEPVNSRARIPVTFKL